MIYIYAGKNSSGKTYKIKEPLEKMDAVIKTIADPKSLTSTTKAKAFLNIKIKKQLSTMMSYNTNLKMTISKLEKDFNELLKPFFKGATVDDLIIKEYMATGYNLIKPLVVSGIHKNNSVNNETFELGSGHDFYLLLKTVKNLKINLENFAIDEPERFLHTSLQIHVAKLLLSISKLKFDKKRNDIYISTHSPTMIKYLITDLAEINFLNPFVNRKGIPSIQDYETSTFKID